MGLEDRVEELKEKRDRRKEEDDDEDKEIYIYVCYVYDERETVFGRTDEAVYYTVRIREEDADTVEEGFWVDEREAINLVTDWEVREYID